MAKFDLRGCPYSSGMEKSIERYEVALEMFHSYFGDPLKTINEILKEDPAFAMGHCFRLACLIATGTSPSEPVFDTALQGARKLAPTMNPREKLHLFAAAAWADVNPKKTVDRHGLIAIDHPRDSLAVHMVHIGEVALGNNRAARDRVARVLPFWKECDPGFGYILGMHAYGLQENYEFEKAEIEGKRALSVMPLDSRAILAVSLSLEKQGRLAEACDFLIEREDDWAPNNRLANRLWGQLAHLYLERGENNKAVALLDRFSPEEAIKTEAGLGTYSSLLWRLNLLDLDVSVQAKPASDYFASTKIENMPGPRICHAVMVHVVAGEFDLARIIVETLATREPKNISQSFVTKEILIILTKALLCFQRGAYAEALRLFCSVWSDIDRLGGGNQRRDLFLLTWIEAAIRANDRSLAKALISERLQNNPNSRMNIRLLSRISARQSMPIGAE